MSDRKLEVTPEILDRVVYGMENQKEELFLDPHDGQLKEKTAERISLIPMPEWSPTDGFRLMDSFIATLPDTAFRRGLADILHSGSGVFRRFKDALRERPGTEGIWRRYKQREMRKVALSWLSRWSDALELESLGPEPDEWDDLSLAEFSVREHNDGDRAFLDSSLESLAAEMGETAWSIGIPGPGSRGLVVEAPGDIPVGCAFSLPGEGSGAVQLGPVYVLPEFRGLGIGRMLTEALIESTAGESECRLATGRVGEATARWLDSLGFEPVFTMWKKQD